MFSKFLSSPLYLTSKIIDNMERLSVIFTLFGVGVYLVDYYFSRSKLKSWGLKEEEEIFFDCIFMTDKGLRGAELSPADKLVPVTKPIVDFIDSAKNSLDICFYVITANNVVEAILAAKRRKVFVRVIVDYNTGLLNNEHTRKFLRAGIPVYAKQTNQNASIMHHKFCIRDKKILLQASMNLTQNTAKGSFDNILLTNCPDLVVPFQDLFNELTVQFSRG